MSCGHQGGVTCKVQEYMASQNNGRDVRLDVMAWMLRIPTGQAHRAVEELRRRNDPSVANYTPMQKEHKANTGQSQPKKSSAPRILRGRRAGIGGMFPSFR